MSDKPPADWPRWLPEPRPAPPPRDRTPTPPEELAAHYIAAIREQITHLERVLANFERDLEER